MLRRLELSSAVWFHGSSQEPGTMVLTFWNYAWFWFWFRFYADANFLRKHEIKVAEPGVLMSFEE
jgi:hypothetical protein